jgi:cbb3-type cytochrome oxidase subunit 3
MLRELFSRLHLFDLPLIAMGIFVAIFVGVLWRVSRRHRRTEYQRMAHLPLADDAFVREHDRRNQR